MKTWHKDKHGPQFHYKNTLWNISRETNCWVVCEGSLFVAEVTHREQAEALVLRLHPSISKASILEAFPGFANHNDVNGADLVDWIGEQLQ
jgi:hypothetical protein